MDSYVCTQAFYHNSAHFFIKKSGVQTGTPENLRHGGAGQSIFSTDSMNL